MPTPAPSKYRIFLMLFWIYTLIAIAWGAWVRISHSGNGCGDHWPLCDGMLIPKFDNHKTGIEYIHRIMTGLYGLFVFYIFFVFRKFDSDPIIKKLNWGLLIVMLIEAGLGAVLVKAELVTVNDSILRLVMMSLHQLNSFILTGISFLFAISVTEKIEFKFSRPVIFFLVVAMTGAIASLATTLFPSISLWDGIQRDFQENSHLFLKLRILHPLLAITLVGGMIYYFWEKRRSRLALELFGAILVGIITLLTLSPIALKISHLMIGHYIWARILYSEFVRFEKPV
jgi:heme a synthase